MNEEYLTIKEFATKAGVSQQSIYKQVKGRLKPFTRREGSKIEISSLALVKFYHADGCISTDTVENLTDTVENETKEIDISTDTVDNSTVKDSHSTEKVEGIDQDIKPNSTEEKGTIDRIIDLLQKELEEKNKQLAIKDKQIEELNNRLAEVIQLNKGQIYISAAEKTTGLLEADNKAEPEPQKKSFWKRLFGK